jgi:reductive dehalogenase
LTAKGRVDERDTMFARMARKQGTPAYEDYYSARPELKRTDDRLRNMAPLMRPGGRYYRPEISAEAERWFREIDGIEPERETVEAWSDRIRRAPNQTAAVKEMALELGAVASGCTALDRAYVYTHKGRFDKDYGDEIRLDHPSAIVFLVEMDFREMRRAPRAEALRESARQYHRAAVISRTMATALEACGYAAKEHYDAHYDLILPPLAVEAGLGELGRNNILIADRHGSRVRIGAVSTDLPLEHDAPRSLGADHFCSICKKCADNCPSRALSTSGKEEVLGVLKWPTEVERCYGYWRAVGTDCGICMACCPFSHSDSLFHNLVRWLVRHVAWTHRAALWFDDLIYGRDWSVR